MVIHSAIHKSWKTKWELSRMFSLAKRKYQDIYPKFICKIFFLVHQLLAWYLGDRFALQRNEPDVLSNQKTDLGSRGDVELLVLHLHGISSGLQHSSVIISLSAIVYVSQNASSFARMCHNPKVWNYIYGNTVPSCQKDTKHFSSRRFGKSRDWREEFGLREKNNVETMCFLGRGANASLKLRLFDTFLTLVKLRSTYRWMKRFANLSYHCYSVSKVTMSSSPEMPESQKCSQIFHGKPDSNLIRVFSLYMFVA